MENRLEETTLSRQQVYKGRIITVEERQNRLPDGQIAPREVILHWGAAAVLPVDGDGMVTLVRQYRVAANDITLEIPAGKLDSPGENMLVCARRELLEETGMAASQMRKLTVMYSSPAILSERSGLYLATGLSAAGEQHLDGDEFLNLVRMPLEEAYRRAVAGEFPDAKTALAILMSYAILNHKTGEM